MLWIFVLTFKWSKYKLAAAFPFMRTPRPSFLLTVRLPTFRMRSDVVDVKILIINDRYLNALAALATPEDLVGAISRPRGINEFEPAISRLSVAVVGASTDQVVEISLSVITAVAIVTTCVVGGLVGVLIECTDSVAVLRHGRNIVVKV